MVWTAEGPLAHRYLNFRRRIVELRNEFGLDTWGVEAFLWRLEQEAEHVSLRGGRPLRKLGDGEAGVCRLSWQR